MSEFWLAFVLSFCMTGLVWSFIAWRRMRR